MNFLPAISASALQALQDRAEINLAKILPRVGPSLAALIVVYSVWDLLLDPANAIQSSMTRVLFAGLAAIGFWPVVSSWTAHFRATWSHWMLSSGVILATAQLDGGLVEGVGGIVLGLFLVPFIANGASHFAITVTPPALLFILCSVAQCTLPELARGLLLYGSAVAVAFMQMRIAIAIRFHALTIERKLIRDATHDALTGIHNRGWLAQQAALAFSAARRYRTELVYVMLDIDFFKRVNDTHGHQVGDEVLKAVARTIQGTLRESDHFGRFGGEEFFCILPHTSKETAMQCAERIRQAVAALEVQAADAVVTVTISIGLAPMMDADGSWEDQLKRSDEALYLAKQSGRNCARFSD
ncbi:GGDEF domain-containing protein [Janthinobacterium sp. LS2A]|uniref:GGDEF domain-containing protein n=1 Tax=Janthinobacterium sp. LS2A TaxID=3118590 RepID=UPI002F920D99